MAPSPEPAAGIAFRRAAAYLIDWSGEPIVALWTTWWLAPLQSPACFVLTATWVSWVVHQLARQAATGQTAGKALLGIEVVDAHTRLPIGRPRTAVRWLGHGVDSLTMVGWLWGARGGRTVGDRWAGTIVRRCGS